MLVVIVGDVGIVVAVAVVVVGVGILFVLVLIVEHDTVVVGVADVNVLVDLHLFAVFR